MKGYVEAILRELRIPDVNFRAQSQVGAYHPGRCAEVFSGETRLGILGQIHPEVCASFDIGVDACTAELGLAELMACRGPEPMYVPLPRFPAVTRDIALVCDNAIPAASLESCIRASGGETLESCALFDVYTGPGIPEGKKSLAFSLTMRAKDQTLTDEHAEETVNAILTALQQELGATIR